MALERDLRAEVDGEVRFDAGTRGAYSTDASQFRQVPLGVVTPRTIDAAAAAVAVCSRHGAPVLSRGGGTSLAGQCTNEAVVIDWSRHCNRLLSVDAERRRCVVEPGIVLDELNRRLAPHGLRYGPEPASHPNCTLGGMIGNNSCGATAQRNGKVVDNTPALEVLLYDGTRFWCGPTDDARHAEIARQGGRRADVYARLRRLAEAEADEIRVRFPDIPRRVSGYNLDSLLPEHGFDVAGLLVGSESTLITVLRAELALVPVVRERALVVLGFGSIADAGDAVAGIVEHEPIALEAFDRRLVRDEQLRHEHAETIEQLPDGDGWLLVQFGGETTEEADERARRLLAHLALPSRRVAFLDDPAREDALWHVREGVLSATSHVPGERDTAEGFDDAAVPPELLGDYLRDLEALYDRHGYLDEAVPAVYGHFGQGCVHSRIPFDLGSERGVADYRRFLEEAADLVVSYGGSISGEHGDGQRGELLERMFGPRIVEAFGEVKAIFDPDGAMNPGKVVDARPLDAGLRLGPGWRARELGPLEFAYPHDGGSFATAAGRCVGVGKCRALDSSGSVMCPSYQATRDEEHSTRGRARLLFEMLDGHGEGPITDGWRSEAVRDALDLCLACKGCRSDCPVNVDMATYKAEFLSHHWQGRLRPRSHYALGWLPLAAHAIARLRLAPVVNALTARPRGRRLAGLAAGLEDRPLPAFASQTLQQWAAARPPFAAGTRGELILWPDTFTNTLHPQVGQAAVGVLEGAGWTVRVPGEPLCCGLTWISTGQLSVAKRVLRRTASALREHLRGGGLVVGLEPSCTAVFRTDAPELLPDDENIHRLSEQTLTLAEVLTQRTPGWSPPRLDARGPRHALVQVHCHQHAVLGWEADAALLRDCGVDARRLDSGCCGLAGNFGFEPGHLAVSRACAERVLLPAVRGADPQTAILADGFSCRTQIEQLGGCGRRAVHLAQLLASADGPGPPDGAAA
ncbi:MAG: FAD-binding and (Fe-S)-binding domain-containing protein [Solirubrobacteraceae bacterium]